MKVVAAHVSTVSLANTQAKKALSRAHRALCTRHHQQAAPLSRIASVTMGTNNSSVAVQRALLANTRQSLAQVLAIPVRLENTLLHLVHWAAASAQQDHTRLLRARARA